MLAGHTCRRRMAWCARCCRSLQTRSVAASTAITSSGTRSWWITCSGTRSSETMCSGPRSSKTMCSGTRSSGITCSGTRSSRIMSCGITCSGTRSSRIMSCGITCCGIMCSGIRSWRIMSCGITFFGTRPCLTRVSRLVTPPLHEQAAREMHATSDLDAVEGDLRPVTILFADVRGFTRLSEVLPPEKLVAAINGCFEVLDESISRYGGEVDKFLGDAVMATFGATIAHDDDPRRAVLAALEMRIGVNTGVVLAGPIGSRRKRAFTVMGDAVNVAARLEHAAPVGSILIGGATRTYLGNLFRLRQRRSIRVRGRDAPVRSYVVLGQSTAHR